MGLALTKETKKQVEKLGGIFNLEDKNAALETSLDLAELVASSMKKGSVVVIEDSNGKRSKITIPGL